MYSEGQDPALVCQSGTDQSEVWLGTTTDFGLQVIWSKLALAHQPYAYFMMMFWFYVDVL